MEDGGKGAGGRGRGGPSGKTGGKVKSFLSTSHNPVTQSHTIKRNDAAINLSLISCLHACIETTPQPKKKKREKKTPLRKNKTKEEKKERERCLDVGNQVCRKM